MIHRSLTALLLCGYFCFAYKLDPGLLRAAIGSTYPGVKIRLTPTAVTYFEDLAIRLISRQIFRFKFPKEIVHNLNGRGYLRLKNISISEFQPPKYYKLNLSTNSVFRWEMRNFSAKATGQFEGLSTFLVTLAAAGEFEVDILDMNLDVVLVLQQEKSGKILIVMDYCHALIHSMDISLQKANVAVARSFGLVKASLLAQVRPRIETEICQKLNDLANNKLNSLLKTADYKFALKKQGKTDLGPPTNGSKSSNSSLMLDYSLLGLPIIYPVRIIDVLMRGEVSWDGLGGTPFYPNFINESTVKLPNLPDGFRVMMQVFASDYLMNSLLYHAHKHKLLQFRINPDNAGFETASLLRTSCGGGLDFLQGQNEPVRRRRFRLKRRRHRRRRQKRQFGSGFTGFQLSYNNQEVIGFCFGDVLPLITQKHPKEKVELRVRTSSPPVVYITPEGASLKSYSSLFVTLYPRPKFIMHMHIRMDANLTFSFMDGKTLTGKLKLTQLKLYPTKGRFGDVAQDMIVLLTDYIRSNIEQMTNEVLSEGVQIPDMQGLNLYWPELTMHDRFAVIQSLFYVDENVAAEFLDKTIES